jgi:hypothetical protein
MSAHKTNRVGAFSEAHPQVKLHFTTTYWSSLNQVEIWFARIEREVIARGVHLSQGSGEENHALYRSVFEARPPHSMEILRCHPENQSMLTNSLRQVTRAFIGIA